MNKLSKRLNQIYELVDGDIIADVGCDHGKLALELLKNNKCKFAYVSDISKDSLQKARDILVGYGNSEAICCDGLQGYEGKRVDECIISGMGGEEIMQIIFSSPIDIDTYILSPQKNEIRVKQFMLDRGYQITFDKIIKDKDKYYHIFKCKKGVYGEEIDILDLYFGKDSFLSKDGDLEQFIEYEINKVNNILPNADEGKRAILTDYLQLLEIANKRKEK